MTRNRNIGLLLIATLLIISVSGIVGAAYDEDDNYVEDVPSYVNEEFVYVVYPFDMSTVASITWAEDYSATTAYGDADLSTITSAYTDMTVPGVQGLGAEE